ncbi:hypothetical protein CDAR_122731 [Caerostris darwini]|uniref:Uncharacterized protein n=1 Tax=Caerostris darwini TaxID=1538125 RepID=A0AAV4UY13_9ARAC|nr:hypothetical protein CDAR_122731 [Caerostris darwini]
MPLGDRCQTSLPPVSDEMGCGFFADKGLAGHRDKDLLNVGQGLPWSHCCWALLAAKRRFLLWRNRKPHKKFPIIIKPCFPDSRRLFPTSNRNEQRKWHCVFMGTQNGRPLNTVPAIKQASNASWRLLSNSTATGIR